MCGSCSARATANGNNFIAKKKKSSKMISTLDANIVSENENCQFNDESIGSIKDNLTWAKQNGKYMDVGIQPRDLNRLLGVVITSLNTKRKCFYEGELIKAEELSIVISTIR